MTPKDSASVSTLLRQRLVEAIHAQGGWLSFDRFMAMALYEPGLGYYARDSRQFGAMPASGSDFVTAPELSPLFGAALAAQLCEALTLCDSGDVLEFGAGSGALAEVLLDELGAQCQRYAIVELSGALRERQRQRLARFGDRVRWFDRLPERFSGVVVGNEVLDAMPVQLLHFDGDAWFERGVVMQGEQVEQGRAFAWADRATALRPPLANAAFAPGTVTEIHPQAEAFIRTLADVLQRGAAFFIDYGFPEAEYYHPQRTGGTLMCHRAHLVDADPLIDVGDKDITAHVNFSGIALAAQATGLDVCGYTSQAHFLFNCGLAAKLEAAAGRARAPAPKHVGQKQLGVGLKVKTL